MDMTRLAASNILFLPPLSGVSLGELPKLWLLDLAWGGSQSSLPITLLAISPPASSSSPSSLWSHCRSTSCVQWCPSSSPPSSWSSCRSTSCAEWCLSKGGGSCDQLFVSVRQVPMILIILISLNIAFQSFGLWHHLDNFFSFPAHDFVESWSKWSASSVISASFSKTDHYTIWLFPVFFVELMDPNLNKMNN